MTYEELEILEFYKGGLSVVLIAECTGHDVYRLKKLLANEPEFKDYVYRPLSPLKFIPALM